MLPALELAATRHPRLRNPRVLILGTYGSSPGGLARGASRVFAGPETWADIATVLRPDLVMIHGLDGLQTVQILRSLRQHRATRAAPALVLPRSTMTAACAGLARGASPWRPVLVLDDDSAFANALVDTVSELGWGAVAHAEAAEALTHIRGGDYGALFVSIDMPGISGLAVLKESLRLWPCAPVAVMTAHDVSQELLRDVACGETVIFLWKPIKLSKVRFALQAFDSGRMG